LIHPDTTTVRLIVPQSDGTETTYVLLAKRWEMTQEQTLSPTYTVGSKIVTHVQGITQPTTLQLEGLILDIVDSAVEPPSPQTVEDPGTLRDFLEVGCTSV